MDEISLDDRKSGITEKVENLCINKFDDKNFNFLKVYFDDNPERPTITTINNFCDVYIFVFDKSEELSKTNLKQSVTHLVTPDSLKKKLKFIYQLSEYDHLTGIHDKIKDASVNDKNFNCIFDYNKFKSSQEASEEGLEIAQSNTTLETGSTSPTQNRIRNSTIRISITITRNSNSYT